MLAVYHHCLLNTISIARPYAFSEHDNSHPHRYAPTLGHSSLREGRKTSLSPFACV